MTEEFLHYVWKYSLFDRHDFLTTEGKKVEIIHSGQHNSDSGPDFLMPSYGLTALSGQAMLKFIYFLPIGTGMDIKMIKLTAM